MRKKYRLEYLLTLEVEANGSDHPLEKWREMAEEAFLEETPCMLVDSDELDLQVNWHSTDIDLIRSTVTEVYDD